MTGLFICLAVGLLAHLSRKGVMGARNILTPGHNRLGFVIMVGGILYFFITWFRLSGSWFTPVVILQKQFSRLGALLFTATAWILIPAHLLYHSMAAGSTSSATWCSASSA